MRVLEVLVQRLVCFCLPFQTEVVRNQNTESMSLPLSAMGTVASASWTVYGLLVDDVYIQVCCMGIGIIYVLMTSVTPQVPNVVGLMLSLVQMALFAQYGTAKKKTIVSMETPMV